MSSRCRRSPRPATVPRAMLVTTVWIETDDGERLAATLYRPDGDGPFAALLEALPYRKDDVTESYRVDATSVSRRGVRGAPARPSRHRIVERDHDRRVSRDRAERSAHDDRVAGVAAVVERAGRHVRHVVLGLQLAADGRRATSPRSARSSRCTPPTIGTPTTCTTRWRAAGDRPDRLPALHGADERAAAGARRCSATAGATNGVAASTRPRRGCSSGWRNPVDGPTWRRGSIRLGPDGDGYERMCCPTMLIAGWADGYRNNTFRVIEQYERNGLPWRLLAGPWVHKSTRRWLDRARTSTTTSRSSRSSTSTSGTARRAPSRTPRCTYVARSSPSPTWSFHPGPLGRPRHVAATRTRFGEPCAATVAASTRSWCAATSASRRGTRVVAACRGVSRSTTATTTRDRSPTTGRSPSRTKWSGAAHVDASCPVRSAVRARQREAVRRVPRRDLGAVTRGMLDLTHVGCWPADPAGAVGRSPASLTPGQWIDTTIDFEATTWTLEPGHTLRLSVAGTDWPNCWPPPGPVTLEIDGDCLDALAPDHAGRVRVDARIPSRPRPVGLRVGRSHVANRARRDRSRDERRHPLRRGVSGRCTERRSSTTTAASSACRP